MKEKFVKELRQILHDAFSATKAGDAISVAEKHRCEGFMRAGVFLGLVDDDEVSHLIHTVHLEVYGQSIAEKRVARGARLH